MCTNRLLPILFIHHPSIFLCAVSCPPVKQSAITMWSKAAKAFSGSALVPSEFELNSIGAPPPPNTRPPSQRRIQPHVHAATTRPLSQRRIQPHACAATTRPHRSRGPPHLPRARSAATHQARLRRRWGKWSFLFSLSLTQVNSPPLSRCRCGAVCCTVWFGTVRCSAVRHSVLL